MTMLELAQTGVTAESRDLSAEVFNRPLQLEVAAAIARLDAGFAIDVLVREAWRAGEAAGVDPPKESAVRTNLAKLVAVGAVQELPAPRRGIPGYYSAVQESAFWAFASELYSRV